MTNREHLRHWPKTSLRSNKNGLKKKRREISLQNVTSRLCLVNATYLLCILAFLCAVRVPEFHRVVCRGGFQQNGEEIWSSGKFDSNSK